MIGKGRPFEDVALHYRVWEKAEDAEGLFRVFHLPGVERELCSFSARFHKNISPLVDVATFRNSRLLSLAAENGCMFECTSRRDLDLMPEAVPLDRVLVGSSCLTNRLMQQALKKGVTLFGVESDADIDRVRRFACQCLLVFRVRRSVPTLGAVRKLLLEASAAGLDVAGLSIRVAPACTLCAEQVVQFASMTMEEAASILGLQTHHVDFGKDQLDLEDPHRGEAEPFDFLALESAVNLFYGGISSVHCSLQVDLSNFILLAIPLSNVKSVLDSALYMCGVKVEEGFTIPSGRSSMRCQVVGTSVREINLSVKTSDTPSSAWTLWMKPLDGERVEIQDGDVLLAQISDVPAVECSAFQMDSLYL
eukprot:TRINITY_DN2428_c0_g1_i1.p1 TRINITY_DN2428_c0_g1~~TRINITY_DN2428_c0_g1_i1.p1  ORF type:complete len:364 (-),score=88.09 TRINITY_DN2428_c0_g1_i1:53-1144(-)